MTPGITCPNCNSGGHVTEAATGRGFTCTECNFYFRAQPRKKSHAGYAQSTRARSHRQESHNARSVGGRITANSGAGRDKGDVKVPGLLREEDKTTRGASYVLKLYDLRKVASAAHGDEIPVLCVSFEDNLNQQYAVIPREWFQQLLDAYRRGGQ